MNKIHCLLFGHRHVNEVQTIAQIFFPNTKFSFEAFSHEGYTVQSRLEGDGCSGEVFRDGVRVARAFIPFQPSKPYFSEKRLLMLSLFEALRTAVAGICAPWGALTGIRPSKLIRAWLAEGLSEREITAILTDEIHCRRDKAELALEVAKAEIKLTGRIFAKPGTAPNLPLGLYISVPFCPTRCAYCSFNLSNQKNDRRLYEAYLSALEV
ncbi:MAG: hypothetical protein LBR83_08690, partial [Clostridiales bacterium]|nr:hypothetical protein [Clostridiales bacterium]